jgi:hypothetical protein
MIKLKRPFSKKPNLNNKKRLLLVICSILFITGLGLAVSDNKLKDNRKVYAQAAGHKVYEEEIRDLIGNDEGVSDHDAAKVLADKYLTEALAKEQGIAVSDQEVEKEFGKEIYKQKSENKFAYQNKLNQIYFNKLAASNRGIYKGQFLVAHFSRYIAYDSPLLQEEKQNDPDIGNVNLIQRDKKYAEDFINHIYKDIESGKINFQEAIKIEHNDSFVGKKAYPTLSHSGSFDTSSSSHSFLQSDATEQHINNMKTGEISEPFVVSVSNSINNDSTAEAYYLIIRLDEASGIKSGIDFEEYLKQAEERLGYAVYV